ncbi:hypothetical protein MYA_3872 [Burkholderia sp. KJ006]|nr:hypothetical protein MYA_3872 [Burkholderia sp. KJ006]
MSGGRRAGGERGCLGRRWRGVAGAITAAAVIVARLIAPHLVASRVIPQHRWLAWAPAVVPSNSSVCPWSGPNARRPGPPHTHP